MKQRQKLNWVEGNTIDRFAGDKFAQDAMILSKRDPRPSFAVNHVWASRAVSTAYKSAELLDSETASRV